jgi:ribosomal protein S18 acetylase RimI-like enzyme
MMELVRWSDVRHDAAQTSFLERFRRAGAGLRVGSFAKSARSSQYTDLVLSLATGRPSDLLIVHDGSRDVARAIVMRHALDETVGVMGLYEAAEGPDGDSATACLVEAGLEWAGAHGVSELYAPVDGNTWFSYRFSLPANPPGTDRPPYHWEPYHPPEYLTRFRALGFEDAELFVTHRLEFPDTGDYRMREAASHGATALQAARNDGLSFHQLGDTPGATPYDEFHRLSNEAFRENPLFEPLSEDLFHGLYAKAMTVAWADFTHWVRDAEGKMLGFVFALNENDQAVIKSIAVDPAARGRKLSTALNHLVFEKAHEQGISTILMALIRRGNTSEFFVTPHRKPGVRTWSREYVLLRQMVNR